MANRRMFSQTIIDSDAFLDMPSSTQVLYFHLSMRADDEGFVNSPKKIQRMVGCNDDDMKLLILKRFILLFESGVIVIKHWKIHNCIRKDRLVETSYQEEKALLYEKENLAYTLDKSKAKVITTTCQPSDNQVTTNSQPDVSIGKDSIGEDRLGKDSIVKDNTVNDFFESVWKIYPKKLGKTAVTAKTKKELQKYSFDEIATAIDRYKKEVNSCTYERDFMHGSTFFNGRYVDYLDSNYEEIEKPKNNKKEDPIFKMIKGEADEQRRNSEINRDDQRCLPVADEYPF